MTTHLRKLRLSRQQDVSTFVKSASKKQKSKVLKRAADSAIREQRAVLRRAGAHFGN